MKCKWQPAALGLCAPGRSNVTRFVCLVLVVAGVASKASAQQGIITTYAGGGPNASAALLAEIINPYSVAVDTSENIYIAAPQMQQVFRVDRSGNLTVVAGNATAGFSGDGGPATSAVLNWPYGVAVDTLGNLFIADSSNSRIRRVDHATGIITTVAGNGSWGFSGDGGPATSANLSSATGVTLDALGNLFIADTDNFRIRRVDAVTGVITTVAGNGSQGFSGDSGPATSAELSWAYGVAVDGLGNLFIADNGNNRIRRVDAATGIITTVAGNGSGAFGGDGGPATSASLKWPSGVALDSLGNLFIADAYNQRIRRVDAVSGIITTVAGNGSWGFSGDGGPATSANLDTPTGVAVDLPGNIFIADLWNSRIRRVDATSGIITTAAGGGSGGDGAAATSAIVVAPWAVAADRRGDLFIADLNEDRIRRVDATSGVITTAAGDGYPNISGDGGAATSASLNGPHGVAVDDSGNLFIADSNNGRIRRVDALSGIITTVAGGGWDGLGDGGPATSASLNGPQGVAVDIRGNIFIADSYNARIRRVSAISGVITTVAGNGTYGFSGDGGPATSAELSWPYGVAVDARGNLFIADTDNDRIRRVDAATGIITNVAGNGRWGFTGDGGPAASASLNWPYGVAVDGLGNLFIADSNNERVRRVDVTTRIITTVAGNGSQGFGGDGGPATSASLHLPLGVALDDLGNLFIADDQNNRVREVPLPPFVALSTNKLSFSREVVGTTSKPQAISVMNTGTAILAISSVTFTGANAGDFGQTNNCPSSVPPGARCAISVTFTPSSVGAESATLNVNDNAAESPQTVALSGTGVALGARSLISVIFTPKRAGKRTATLTITDDAPDSPQTVALTRTGK